MKSLTLSWTLLWQPRSKSIFEIYSISIFKITQKNYESTYKILDIAVAAPVQKFEIYLKIDLKSHGADRELRELND